MLAEKEFLPLHIRTLAIGHAVSNGAHPIAMEFYLMSNVSNVNKPSLFAALTGAIVSTVSVVTTTAEACNSLANAGNQLAKVAENKATRFGELIEMKDQMVYNATKHELDQQVAALAASLTPKKS